MDEVPIELKHSSEALGVIVLRRHVQGLVWGDTTLTLVLHGGAEINIERYTRVDNYFVYDIRDQIWPPPPTPGSPDPYRGEDTSG